MNNKIVAGIAVLTLGLLALAPSAAADQPDRPAECTLHQPPRGNILGEVFYIAGTAVAGACVIAEIALEGGKEAALDAALFAKETSESMTGFVTETNDLVMDHARMQANRFCVALTGQACV